MQALVLAEGGSGGEDWRLSGYRTDHRLCLRLTVRTTGVAPAISCFKHWSGGDAEYLSMASREHSYIAGRVPPGATSVAVKVGDRRATVQALTPAGESSVTEQDGHAYRVFVATFTPTVPPGSRADVTTTPSG